VVQVPVQLWTGVVQFLDHVVQRLDHHWATPAHPWTSDRATGPGVDHGLVQIWAASWTTVRPVVQAWTTAVQALTGPPVQWSTHGRDRFDHPHTW